jgi:lipopolysaccharide transport system permease protein
VFFRDIQYLIGVVLQMLSFLSPVFYNLENLPPQFQKKLLFNPMVWFIEANRKILFVDCMPGYNSLPSVTEWAGIYIFGTVAFLLGYIWFFKTKRGFSDVL